MTKGELKSLIQSNPCYAGVGGGWNCPSICK